MIFEHTENSEFEENFQNDYKSVSGKCNMAVQFDINDEPVSNVVLNGKLIRAKIIKKIKNQNE